MAAIALLNGAAEARDEQPHTVDIAASTLPQAIAELAREMRVSIGSDVTLPNIRTGAIHGRLRVREALARLLAGTGYTARKVGHTAWRIEHVQAATVKRPELARATETASLNDGALDLQPIVVTGSKRSRSLSVLPMAVSVLNLSELERHDTGNETAKVAGEVEGLALTALGPGRNRMFVRGISDGPFNGESQSTVAVVLDDTRLTYAAPDPDIRLVDMERVEVLKGPQGSLYGTGALGGIYHLVSRRADVDEATLSASAGAQVVAMGDTGITGSAIGNLPIVPGHAALRLVGYVADEPGWVTTGMRRDANGTRLSGARAGLGVEPGGDWRLDLTGFAQWLESRDSRYVYKAGSRSRPDQLAEPHDNDLRHLSARIARRGGGADIVVSSGITWHEVGDTLDAQIGAESFGLADPRLLEDSRYYRVWDSEFRSSGRWRSLEWLAGLSHVQAKQADLSTLLARSDAQLVIDDDRRTTYDTAAFTDLTFAISGRLKLDAGARLFRSAVKETRTIPGGAVHRDRHRTGLTPSAAISWTPNVNRLIFLRYGSAFRQGGTDISPNGQLEELKGDELAMIEGGWREQLPMRGKLDVGVWHAWWENLQSDMLQPDGLIETRTAGNARIFGAEAAIELPLGPAWQIAGGANVTIAKLVDNAMGKTLDDRHLPVVPKYTLRASLRHDFRIAGGDFWLRAYVRYVGPAKLSFEPAQDRPMGKVLETRFEAHATHDRFEIALAVENLLDNRADTFAYGNSLRFAQMRQFTPQRPLTVSLSIVRSF